MELSELLTFSVQQKASSSDSSSSDSDSSSSCNEDNNVELFAMGIRNSFGLAVDPVTGKRKREGDQNSTQAKPLITPVGYKEPSSI